MTQDCIAQIISDIINKKALLKISQDFSTCIDILGHNLTFDIKRRCCLRF